MKACVTIVWTAAVVLLAWSVFGGESSTGGAPAPKVPVAAQEDPTEGTETEESAEEEAPAEVEEPPVVEKAAITVRPVETEDFTIEKALEYPLYEFRMAGRRDPFARPDQAEAALPGAQDTTGGGSTVITLPDKLTVEQQKELVDKAATLLAQIKERIDAQEYREAVRIHDRELAPILKRREDITVPNLKARLTAVETQAATIEKAIAEAKVTVLHEQMIEMESVLLSSWKAADYGVVVEQAGSIQEAFSDAREVLLTASDSEKKRRIAQIKTEADSYGHRGQVRLEFADKELVISGIAWSPGRSFAIVNGRDMGVGAVIDEVKIVEITTSKVTMEYKGETFDKYVE